MDINDPEILRLVQELKPEPWLEYQGVAYPPYIPFRLKGIEKHFEDIKNLQSRETDILICTYAKSGTHWIYEIISLLYKKSTELDKTSKSQTMLEIMPDLSVLDGVSSPRIFDTHIPFPCIPKMHVEIGAKIVHMMRNPKDVCVSLYYHTRKDVFMNMNLPWDEYFESWMSGKLPYGTWYDYELGMEKAEKDNPKIIYTCYYENMKKNPIEEIRKLSEFLGIAVSDDLIEGIAKTTSFENMQKNKFDPSKLIDKKEGTGFIFRKGGIGDWKNHFTVAQNERFDAQYEDKMKNSQYKFEFQ